MPDAPGPAACTSALCTAVGGLTMYEEVSTSVEVLTGVAGVMKQE